ncbi:MAG: cytochrome d ubiquinol oxidase subunit II, partial [Ignavibacteria bacterium]|nr:cytochrome d ubiquinol oxidase subunit II [Ignavibacteria bacterium]
LLDGVAMGNIMKGIPLTKDGIFLGNLLTLLNPYSILIGILTVNLFVLHGAIFMTLKTEGELREWMKKWINGSWISFVILYFIATVASFFAAPFLFEGILSNALFWIFFILLLLSLVYIPIAMKSEKYNLAFLSSSLMIACIISLIAVSLFPMLVPSSLDLEYSLTIYNASSSQLTLKTMLIIAIIGMPIVIAYTIFIYKVFKGKVVLTKDSY